MKMMSNLARVMSCLFLLSIVACNMSDEKNATDKLMDEYYSSIKEQDFENALNFYGSEFFNNTPRTEWLETLVAINKKLGTLQSYSVVSWRVQTNLGTPSSIFYLIEYKVNYALFAANETLTLFKPNGSAEIKIIRHQIISPGLVR